MTTLSDLLEVHYPDREMRHSIKSALMRLQCITIRLPNKLSLFTSAHRNDQRRSMDISNHTT